MTAEIVNLTDHQEPFPQGQITKEFVIHGILPEFIPELWVTKAYAVLATCDGFKTDAAEIYDMLLRKHAQLLYYPPGAWAISKILVDIEGNQELFLWYLANDRKNNHVPFLPSARALMLLFESFGVSIGCKTVSFYGDLRWNKIVPEYSIYAKYTKELDYGKQESH